MYNPMVEEIKKLDAKVKDLTKKIEIYKEQVKILKAKLEEKGNDRDNKTNS
jgi:chaperonin cofactor prefoldin